MPNKYKVEFILIDNFEENKVLEPMNEGELKEEITIAMQDASLETTDLKIEKIN